MKEQFKISKDLIGLQPIDLILTNIAPKPHIGKFAENFRLANGR